MRLTAQKKRYKGGLAKKIKGYVAKNVLPLSAHTWYWQRAMRWVKEFGAFASRLRKDEGEALSQVHEPIQSLLEDEEAIEIFIGWLALKKVGFSVPRSARRFLSAARMRLGFKSLNDKMSVSDIIRGHERSTPRSVKKAEGLEVDDVIRIAEAYGTSKHWWLLQVATMVALGFVAIMRLGELTPLKMEGVVLVMQNGKECRVSELDFIPRLRDVKGAFLGVRWRKSDQARCVGVPISCRMALGLLLRHLRLLKRAGRSVGPLFPSRMGGSVSAKRNPTNSVSNSSISDALRKALVDVCGLSEEQAKLFSGHSLRVGGSNYMRRLGVADEVHRLVGDWASLVSSTNYYALSSAEQFAVTDKFMLKDPGIWRARINY